MHTPLCAQRFSEGLHVAAGAPVFAPASHVTPTSLVSVDEELYALAASSARCGGGGMT